MPTAVNGNVLWASLGLLRGRWGALLAVAVLALGPAVAATSLVEVLGTRSGAIVNGSVAASRPWTDVVLAADVAGGQVRLTIPVLLALAWFVGLGAGLLVLHGCPVRDAWPARLGRWLALGAVLGALTLLSVLASVAMSGSADRLLGVLTAVVCAFGLARLALALPAMLIDGYDLSTSLRHAVTVTRGRTLLTGTALILVGAGPPWMAFTLVDPAVLPRGSSWVEDVIWVGLGSLLEYLALVLVFPLQVAVLLGAYRFATPPVSSPPPQQAGTAQREPADEPTPEPDRAHDRELELTVTIEGVPSPARRPELPVRMPDPAPRSPAWLRVAGVALLAVVPPAIGPAAVLANPYGLAVLTIARPEAGFSPRPLAMTVLDDGTVAFVDSMQVTLCRDIHCTDPDLMSLPCYDGGEPGPAGGPVRSCATEGPLIAADITADGTLLTVTHGRDQRVRLFWCRLEATPDGQCRWGGATELYRQPDLWQYWSMDVTALPGGGFAAVMIAPGPTDQTLTLRLALCERLDCPRPTVHSGLTVPRSATSGLVALAADAETGNLVLGYFDRLNRSVSLGGCPAGCPDGPVLNPVYAPGEFADNPPPRLQVAGTPAGPVAAFNVHRVGAGRTGVVIGCHDLACPPGSRIDISAHMTNASLALNRAGEAYVAGTLGPLPIFGPVGAEAYSSLPSTGRVVTAACGPDGRLVLVLDDDQPNLAVVTYPGPFCSGGPRR